MEIQILSFNFFLYTISGLWRPMHWSSKRSKLLYNIFTFFSLYLVIYFFFTHLMYLIFVIEDLKGLASNCFIFLSATNLTFKAITIVIRRDKIINSIKILQGKPCTACDKTEAQIQIKFDRLIKSYSMPYIIICSLSTINTLISGTLYILNGQIPYGLAWVPWDCSSFLVFFFTSLQEIMAVTIGIFINVATETIVLGFCLQICARFEILRHRLENMIKRGDKEYNTNASNKSRLSKYISHHRCIIRLAEMINDIFSQVFFVQFGTSVLILCSLIYHLSSNITFIDALTLTAYAFSMFIQIFYYCLGGNEVTLKSAGFANDIYNMNWILMTNNEQKDLLIIMKYCTRPIKFTSSFLVSLSLESYSNLLKTSFSAFNVMQQL